MLTPRLHATLVTLMVETRDWNPTACREAVQALHDKAPGLRPASLARIVGAYVAHENEQGGAYYTSPALLPQPGAHWDKTEYATRQVRPKCPDHHVEYPCGPCNERPLPNGDEIRAIRHKARQDTAPDRQATRHALHGRTET